MAYLDHLGETATTSALVDFLAVPGLRICLNNALVALGLGAGASGREGQIGGDRILGDQAFPALAIELWGMVPTAKGPRPKLLPDQPFQSPSLEDGLGECSGYPP